MAKKSTIADAIPAETAENLKKTYPAELEKAETTEPLKRNLRPRYKHPDTMEDALKRYPAHIVKLVNLIKSNSDIRRYTSLGILNYLSQKGIINNSKGYVSFNWTKFRVNSNGLGVEYRYIEPFFINCLIASFTSFANAAQKIIKLFCSKELDANFVQDDSVIEEAVAVADEADESSDEE